MYVVRPSHTLVPVEMRDPLDPPVVFAPCKVTEWPASVGRVVPLFRTEGITLINAKAVSVDGDVSTVEYEDYEPRNP
jgi:hypothetical protein